MTGCERSGHVGEENINVKYYGPVVEQEMWRIRTNQELRELYKYLDIVADIKKETLEWIGLVVRINQGRTVKKAFERKLEGSRRGTPRLEWLEDVEKDLRETKLKRWRQKAVDSEEWASAIKDAKAEGRRAKE